VQLDAIRVGMLREAVRIYLSLAYPAGGGPRVELTGDDEAPSTEALASLVDESSLDPGCACRRYVLRLGNSRYPFMKWVLQEHLIRGEFFLSVDTHDQMFKGADAAEQKEIEEIKSFNRALGTQIERAWLAASLPTQSQLRGLAESLPIEPQPPNGRRILVVDDEQDIADTIELLLRAKGYDVDRAKDGREALAMVDPARHQLILMDNEMPHLYGLEVCDILKEKPETRNIPILLATAGTIDMTQVRRADAFLTKPFESEILFSFVERLLSESRKAGR
jgi:CheY-like chemotaxis protein